SIHRYLWPRYCPQSYGAVRLDPCSAGTPVEPQAQGMHMPKRLTTRYVESVKVTVTRTDFRDDQVEGLILRVTPSGQKTWSMMYRREADGRRRRHTIGRFPNFSLDDARRQAKQVAAAVARGGDPAGEARHRRKAINFGDLVD